MSDATPDRPAEALSAPAAGLSRTAERARSGEIVIHPSTGVVLGDAPGLEAQPAEILAECFAVVDEQMARLRAMRGLLDHELARRLDEKDRKVWPVGDFEVSLKGGNSREWDGDELEAVIRDLIDGGVVNAAELTGLIRHETKVNGTVGNRLRSRLSGEALRAVDACWTWQKGRRKLEVVRSIPLIPDRRSE
jgi:hypothetical protein